MAKRDKARAKVDWESIERDYRAGILSIREIARQHGVTEGPIRRKANQQGWQRDLTKRVKARAQEKLSSATDAGDARDAEKDAPPTREQEERAVEENAERVTSVVQTHRQDVRRGRELVETMFGELMRACEMPNLSGAAEQHIQDEGLSPNQATAVRKAVSLPGRAGTMRDLTQSIQRLISLERQAYKLDNDDDGSDDGGLASRLEAAQQRVSRGEGHRGR